MCGGGNTLMQILQSIMLAFSLFSLTHTLTHTYTHTQKQKVLLGTKGAGSVHHTEVNSHAQTRFQTRNPLYVFIATIPAARGGALHEMRAIGVGDDARITKEAGGGSSVGSTPLQPAIPPEPPTSAETPLVVRRDDKILRIARLPPPLPPPK